MGYTIVYLSLLVLIPLSTLFFKSAGIGWSGFWAAATSPRVMAAYRLSLSASMIGALAFARALGEYGSVVFISGNLPMKTEVVPLLIMAKLEQFDYAGATAIAVVMLALSFTLILGINFIQRWTARRFA